MAYSAPKWTQMTAPSGTTSVNALTSAGDLFSKAMDAASDGLKSYDKGVESRLQEDSDVNTAALRRRLESATDLDSLNAMQGDISASGLEGYGKRIDADALSASFDKEQGVMRNEFQQEFNENFSQRMAESKTPEDFAARQAELTQANTDNSFLDISGQITSVADASRSAKEKRTQQETIQFGLDNRGKSYADLTTAIGTIKGVDDGAVAKRAALESEQKVALARETQKVSEDLALLDAGVTDMTGREAYNIALTKAQEKYPQVNFSQLISDAKKSTEEQRNQDETGVTNSLYLEALNLSSISDIENLSKKIDTNGPFFAQQTKILEDRKKVVFADQQAKFDKDVADLVSDAASRGQAETNKLRERIASPEFALKYGTKINIGKVDQLFAGSKVRADAASLQDLTIDFNLDIENFNKNNGIAVDKAIASVPGADQFAKRDSNGNLVIDTYAPASVRLLLKEAIIKEGWKQPPTNKEAEKNLRARLNTEGYDATQVDAAVELNESIKKEETALTGENKTNYDVEIATSAQTMQTAISDAQNAYESIQDHADFSDKFAFALDDGKTVKEFITARVNTNWGPDFISWDIGASGTKDVISDIQSGKVVLKDANDKPIDKSLITDFQYKAAIEVLLLGNDKIDNRATLIAELGRQIGENTSDQEFLRKRSAYTAWKSTEVQAGLQHTIRKNSILGKYQTLEGVRSTANTMTQVNMLQAPASGIVTSASGGANTNTSVAAPALGVNTVITNPWSTGTSQFNSAPTTVSNTIQGLKAQLAQSLQNQSSTLGSIPNPGLNQNAVNNNITTITNALNQVTANKYFPTGGVTAMKALVNSVTSSQATNTAMGQAVSVNVNALTQKLTNLGVPQNDMQRVIDYVQSL